MTGEEREVDGVPLLGQGQRQRPHGLGVAREAVQHEHAPPVAVVGEGLGTGNDRGGHDEMVGHRTREPAQDIVRTALNGSNDQKGGDTLVNQYPTPAARRVW